MSRPKERTVIGVAERIDLPDWGVARLRAKIDTGARTSALHVNKVEELDGDRVRFTIVLHRDKHDERVTVIAPIVRRALVRSSSGRSQPRIFVATRLLLGGVEREIEISLASRRRMVFRMLLGRSALAEDFLVDPSRRYVCSPPKVKKARGVKKKRGAT
ncbi:MAG: ATP-dependent zinc protease [Sandaracinaceae bacterium]|nr:ATP-dependent zinc protease [Sandaracinaceae bacterium]